MEPGRFIRSGIAASALAHLSILAVVLVFAEVHPFGSVTAETIATHEEVAPVPEKPEPPKADPSDAFDLSSKSAPSESPAPQPAAASTSPAQAIPPSARPDRREAAAQPPTPPASPLPAYVPPQPDLSIKYHVMLGLPPDLSPSLPRASSGDAFDDQASKAADIAASLVTEFRRHLRTCSKLPASIAPSDKGQGQAAGAHDA